MRSARGSGPGSAGASWAPCSRDHPLRAVPATPRATPWSRKFFTIQMQLWLGPELGWATAGRTAQGQGEGLEGVLLPRAQHQGLWGDSWVLADPEPPLRISTSRPAWDPVSGSAYPDPSWLGCRFPYSSFPLWPDPLSIPQLRTQQALTLPGSQHPNALICDKEASLSCKAVMTLVTGTCGVQVQLGFFPYRARKWWTQATTVTPRHVAEASLNLATWPLPAQGGPYLDC